MNWLNITTKKCLQHGLALVHRIYENPSVSIRSAEATSLARAVGFSRIGVSKFFEILKKLYEKYKYGPSQIWNADETALTTVQGTNKVVSQKGQKQVGQVTSSERGIVTPCHRF